MTNIISVLLLIAQLTSSDQQRALQIHNEAREEVGCSPLTWSNELASEAQAYAEHLANTGRFEHADTPDGENLYWFSAVTATPAEDACESWLEEKTQYKHGKNWSSNVYDVGHYTQMIWSATKRVGIGYAVGADGSTYVVARYHPTGNYLNEKPY